MRSGNKPAASDMDDVEFLWSCVRDGKLSKEAALDLLEKRAEIFSSDESDGQGETRGTKAPARAHSLSHSHSSTGSGVEKGKAAFYSVGTKRYLG